MHSIGTRSGRSLNLIFDPRLSAFLSNIAHKVYDVAHGRVKAQGASATGDQLRTGDRDSTCKQRNNRDRAGQVLRSSRKRSVQCRHRATLSISGAICVIFMMAFKSPDDTNADSAVHCSSTRLASTRPSPDAIKTLRLPRPSRATEARLDFATLVIYWRRIKTPILSV